MQVLGAISQLSNEDKLRRDCSDDPVLNVYTNDISSSKTVQLCIRQICAQFLRRTNKQFRSKKKLTRLRNECVGVKHVSQSYIPSKNY